MCENPSNNNAKRTGVVVGCSLSSVLVLPVWIIVARLWRPGVIKAE